MSGTILKQQLGFSGKIKSENHKPILLLVAFFIFLILLMGSSGCKKNGDVPLKGEFHQVNLVADVTGFGAEKIDVSLNNAWGIAVAPSGPIWISANGTGLTTIYDKTGSTLRPPVTIPAFNMTSGGVPSGVVFNSTTDFMISGKQASKFIYVTEDGIIAAWGGGDIATKVADRSEWGAVYKGVALGVVGADNFLYAANFHANTIDVFDKNFTLVTDKPFMDPNIPAGFAPFNIRNIKGKLFVTYAKQKAPDNHDDQKGAGNGFVDIFNTDGHLITRFVSRGWLNSPWGIAQLSSDEDDILIGNFGDGKINVFDINGRFDGQLMGKDRKPIVIDGLWAIETNVPTANPNQIFFTAGPNDESHGLFGYLTKDN